MNPNPLSRTKRLIVPLEAIHSTPEKMASITRTMCDRLPKRGAAQLEPSVFAPETRSSYGVRRRTQPCVLGAEPNPAVPQTVVSRGPSGAAARRVREDNPEAALALASLLSASGA